ncbi:MAG: GNAT family N-acetyltransferase [Candidatus Lokiarchaeota archaeon]|nr:GNAT family N-acetyltransferase [Candidatus Lokiarchaeota archaeon]
MLEIVDGLDEFVERDFWDYILRDIPRYFFFILDLKHYPEDCHFLIAKRDGIIVGICLIWKNHIAQIRSEDPEVIEALYRAIPQEIPIDEITFENRYRDLLFSLIPNPIKQMSLHRMILQKEKMIPRYPLEKPYSKQLLNREDVDKIVELMRVSDPDLWGFTTEEKFTFDENKTYTGLFDGNKLICFTLAWVDEIAAIISIVATHPDYQNQGLASYLVNEAVHMFMEHTEIAIIHVRTDNSQAIRVYEKMGYEIYMTYQNVRF